MNESHQKRLLDAGPTLYRNYGEESGLSKWGFELEDGWFDLLLELTEKAEAIIRTLPGEEQRRFRVTQVKEKCGTLRVYTREIYEPLFFLFREGRERSEQICELCGKPGHLYENKRGWIVTRCEGCS